MHVVEVVSKSGRHINNYYCIHILSSIWLCIIRFKTNKVRPAWKLNGAIWKWCCFQLSWVRGRENVAHTRSNSISNCAMNLNTSHKCLVSHLGHQHDPPHLHLHDLHFKQVGSNSLCTARFSNTTMQNLQCKCNHKKYAIPPCTARSWLGASSPPCRSDTPAPSSQSPPSTALPLLTRGSWLEWCKISRGTIFEYKQDKKASDVCSS